MGLIKWDEGVDESFPIYVTRKTAAGETMQYSMPLRQSIRAMLLVYLNVVLWGLIALVAGIAVVIAAVVHGVSLIVGLF